MKVYPPAYDSETGGVLKVNVAGWDGEGDGFARRGVPVGHTAESPEGEFHLNRECPWNR